MGKLVIVFVFTLGALLMLESAQAGDCRKYKQKGYVYIVQKLRKIDGATWYKIGASDDPDKRFLDGKSADNPFPLKVIKKYYVFGCIRRQRMM